ncbi:MAG TPA: hypothetical protein PLN21_04780 [Gemmatales bacterium]|nr:hypothetical protein [Gemmatales bacterium]
MLRFLASLVVFVCASSSLFAQPTPRLTIISPLGGQAGTSVQVTITGVDLEDVTSLMIFPAGLTVERIPAPPKAEPAKSEPTKKTEPGKKTEPAKKEEPAKKTEPAPKPEFLPNQFIIKIPKDMQPGNFDVRAVGAFGITNPRTFVVGELPELMEKEPNNDVPQAQAIALNTTVNGTISAPNDVDYFSVTCKKDETVLVHVAAESIDSRLEPDVRVFNTAGRLMAANRPRAEPDGFCQFTAAAEGVYYIRLCAHAHVEGNAESFYRLSVSTRPYIEAIYPNVVEPGKAASATLWGRNLVGATVDPQFKVGGLPVQKLNVTLAPPSEASATQQLVGSPWSPPNRGGLDAYFYRVKNASGWSNSVPIAYAHGPVILENGDHATSAKAQQVPVPCEIFGRIERANDRDWYTFNGKKDEVLSIEGFAERMGIPIDLYFEVRRDNGALVGEFDENPDQTAYHRFFSRTDDPSTRVTLPADGKYLLMVSSRDATLRGDPRLTYRISLHKPRPDFRAVVVDAHPTNPGSMRLVPGSRQHADIILYRKDGFTGPVTLSVEGLPAGVTCSSAIVTAGAMTGSLVFSATDKVAEFNGAITIKASATIDGQAVTREVRSGCLIWPNANEAANGPGISRLCRSTVLAVRAGQQPFKITQPSDALALPVGGSQNLKLKVERLTPEAKQPIVLNAVHLPAGVTFNNNNQPLTIPADKNEIEVKLLIQGNSAVEQFPLVLRGVAQVPFAKDPKAKQKPNTQMAETASVTNVTVYRKVVDIVLPATTFDLKQGEELTIPIKLNRLHGYQGPINVQAQGLPKGATAAAITIAEKVNEGKLVIKAAKNAAETKAGAVTLRGSGSAMGITLNSDVKLSLNLIK